LLKFFPSDSKSLRRVKKPSIRGGKRSQRPVESLNRSEIWNIKTFDLVLEIPLWKSALIFRRLVDIVRPKMYNKININIIENNLVHERESNAPYKIDGREDCKDYSRI
jgi:hypothetical protein